MSGPGDPQFASRCRCFTLYAAIAVASARAFGADVDKNILVSLSSARGQALVPPWLVSAVSLAMTVVMVCVFPLNAYGLRVGLHALAHGERAESACERWGGALLLVAPATLVAATVDDLGMFLQLVGATTGVYIMFLLPSALLLRIAARGPAASATRAYVPPKPAGAGAPAAAPEQAALLKPPASASTPPAVSVHAAAALLCAGLCIGVCGTAAIFL